ncbi:putative serine protease F56F10.1 [Saccostrea echinata]|uniref:putative serine protease F56F10.1 n=1 Tax=Saccostrea echinata TaxID=191078 RepID=UPI002A808C1C|nr:putative serine protease F56F10.1 [Saccostrea echinata]XP_061194516.1 putative serine protease F56F10.1 [Saccostrea echinata]
MAASIRTMLILNLFLNLSFVSCLPRFFHGRPKHGMLGAPILPQESVLPPDMWMTQRLTHFNDADTRTWQQRYFVNDTFYEPGGPIFVMIGGEGTANPAWMLQGTWIEYAKTYKAICFLLEHRFYGKSHPTVDLSVDNLQFLNSEQALADLAYFIQFVKQKYKLLSEKQKLITFGGSYPGSLSAWFRLKYPHLVDGAVATSAPIVAKLDFKEYLLVVVSSLATTGQGCNKNIKMATDAITNMLKTDAGKKNVEKMFKLCDPLDTSTYLDGANLFSNLAGNFEGVVQYNKDNRAFEGAIGTNITIDTICGIMTDESTGSPVERYAKVNDLMLSTYSQKCLDNSFNSMIKELQNVSWNASASEGGRQWMYQTCTEFGFFQSSDLGDTQPFGNFFDVNFSVQQCIDIFGPKFNQNLIQQGINRTNTNYGGMGMKATRIVFPNGSIDPWHFLGFTNDLSKESPAIFIQGTAHCANMYPTASNDPPQLVQARANIEKIIATWLM